MKKIAFIGGYDKTDLILYMAKILRVLNRKVLFVDTTLTAKTQYIVPTLTPTKKYVTTYDGIDVAIGFRSIDEFKEYQSIEGSLDKEYDYMLIDLDSEAAYRNFDINKNDVHLFMTSFDVYSMQKGVNVLKGIKELTNVYKVLFTKDSDSDEAEYLDFITLSYNVKWDDTIIYFPFETSDLYAIFQNQRFSKVKFFNLSAEYMDSLMLLIEMATEYSKNDIKKAIKFIDRD